VHPHVVYRKINVLTSQFRHNWQVEGVSFVGSSTHVSVGQTLSVIGLASGATAVIRGLLLGLWEMANPEFGHGRYTINPVCAVRPWTFCIHQAVRPLGFIAGLIGVLTKRRGSVLVESLLLCSLNLVLGLKPVVKF
jgi:hypothetical protein